MESCVFCVLYFSLFAFCKPIVVCLCCCLVSLHFAGCSLLEIVSEMQRKYLGRAPGVRCRGVREAGLGRGDWAVLQSQQSLVPGAAELGRLYRVLCAGAKGPGLYSCRAQ